MTGAAAQTYVTLKSDLLSYCDKVNDDLFIAQLPRIVMYAENRIATDLKTEGNEKVVTGIFGANNNVADKPGFWRDTVSITIVTQAGKRVSLYKRAYEYCRNFWPTPTLTALPRFYADYDFNHILIVPTPALNHAFEWIYHCRLDPLSDDNQTNWNTVNAPQLLFQACMLESHLFLKNQNDATLWGNFYKDSLEQLQTEEGGRKVDATTVPK